MAANRQAGQSLPGDPADAGDDGHTPSCAHDIGVGEHHPQRPQGPRHQAQQEGHPNHRSPQAIAVPHEMNRTGALALDAGVKEGHAAV